jgi:hypothetical protein
MVSFKLLVLLVGIVGDVEAATTKVFEWHPWLHANKNTMECLKACCGHAPSQITCTEVNDKPEYDESALWRCEGRMESGFDLGEAKVTCQNSTETIDQPRAGCDLKFTMQGPFCDWSWVSYFAYCAAYFLFLVVLVVVCAFKPILLLGGVGSRGGSHVSSVMG